MKASTATKDAPVGTRGLQEISVPRLLIGLLLLGLLGWNASVLLGVPRSGVADNGDFWRVGQPAGVHGLDRQDPRGRWVAPLYRTGPQDILSLPSTPAGVVLLSRTAQPLLRTNPGLYDIRQAGFAYLALMTGLIGAAVLARIGSLEILTGAFIISDASFLLFFNSLYADGTMILALFGITLWLSRLGTLSDWEGLDPRTKVAAWSLIIFSVGLGTLSKMQYSMLGLVALPFVVALSSSTRAKGWLLASIALLALAAPAHFLFGSGANFATVNKYHATYSGIVRLASEPERTLESLKIPKAHWGLPRKDVFSSGIGASHPVQETLSEISRTDLALAYLKDPPAIARGARAVFGEFSQRRSHRRGTLERAMTPAGRRPYTSWPVSFGSLRRLSLSTSDQTIPLFLLASAVWVPWAYFRKRWAAFHTLQVFLLTWVFTQAVVAVHGDGLVSLRQHLLGARLGVDLLIGFTLLHVAQEVTAWLRARWIVRR